MFAKEFGKGGDRDVEFVLSVQGFEWVCLFSRETGRCEEVRQGRTAGARIWEAGEGDGR